VVCSNKKATKSCLIAAKWRKIVTTFFFPDFTVGSGFSPDLLSPELGSFKPLAGLSDRSESPPVGNCSGCRFLREPSRTLP